MAQCRASRSPIIMGALLCVLAGCGAQNPIPQNLSPAVVIRQEGMDALHDELTARVASVPANALGILDSGANEICTANANLALALMRSKGIASRSMAVIPPISQRLEMHRIVEYREHDQWLYFDPSSLYADVPMKPWQTVIMAKTTVPDEDVAMTPRMGSMPGCPYAQEMELMSTGVTLWGNDFFWTIAKPLADFQPDDTAVSLAAGGWSRYLQAGTLSPGQIKASSATSSKEFQEALKVK